jgi:hypothetical protein
MNIYPLVDEPPAPDPRMAMPRAVGIVAFRREYISSKEIEDA